MDIPGTGTSPDTICGQYSGFACIDPEAYCVDDDDVIVADINVVFPDLVGDGFCDESNNKPEQSKSIMFSPHESPNSFLIGTSNA